METLMESTKQNISRANTVAMPEKELNLSQVREMMNDKKYFDPRFRDKDYVRKVDEAFGRLQLAGKL